MLLMKFNSELESIKEFLDLKHDEYNRPVFISADPISIPHQFTRREDIEISGFLTSIISWGRREGILKNARRLMGMMSYSPYDFTCHASEREIRPMENFVHRTFNGEDCIYFVKALREIYTHHGGLEDAFLREFDGKQISTAITGFRKIFFSGEHPDRTEKHIADPSRGASAKRINMFLRWMVRKDHRGVDFGLWTRFPASVLQCPLDVHSGNVARKLGLLKRKQNDWKAVMQLTERLRIFDPDDPVKYDFALFALGVYENF